MGNACVDVYTRHVRARVVPNATISVAFSSLPNETNDCLEKIDYNAAYHAAYILNRKPGTARQGLSTSAGGTSIFRETFVSFVRARNVDAEFPERVVVARSVVLRPGRPKPFRACL